MNWAKPGAPCICISRNPQWDRFPAINTPTIGATYTVRSVSPDGDAILLNEIVNSARMLLLDRPNWDIGEPEFGVDRFVPIVPDQAERTTQAEEITA